MPGDSADIARQLVNHAGKSSHTLLLPMLKEFSGSFKYWWSYSSMYDDLIQPIIFMVVQIIGNCIERGETAISFSAIGSEGESRLMC